MSKVVRCIYCRRRLRVEDDAADTTPCPTCGKETPFEPADDVLPLPERPPPRRSTARPEDDPDDDFDGRPIRRRSAAPPGKVQAIAIMILIGGILAILLSLIWGASSMGICCLWPGTYYSLVVGILATIKGSNLLGKNAHLEPAPRTTAILMIINIVNLDVTNLVLGILVLVFLNDPEVEDYYRG